MIAKPCQCLYAGQRHISKDQLYKITNKHNKIGCCKNKPSPVKRNNKNKNFKKC